MAIQAPALKMVPVESDLFESIGYVTGSRQLYIKFRNTPALCFNNVPGFRYEGLLNAPRKDAYYKTFIKDFFISKPVDLPPPQF
jgi:KTSC domain